METAEFGALYKDEIHPLEVKQLYEWPQVLRSLGHFTVATVAGNFLPIKHGMRHGVDQN